jgi:hypothetical protein
MQITAHKIKHSAPFLWDLVYNLLDTNPSHRHAMVHNLDDAKIIEGLAIVQEGDLGKIGGDNKMDVREGNEDIDKQEVKAKKRRIRAALRNAALLVIVSCSYATCVPSGLNLSRNQLFPSAFLHKAQTSDLTIFKVSSEFFFTQLGSQRKLSRCSHK